MPTIINQINHMVLPINPAGPQTGKRGIIVANSSGWAKKQIPAEQYPNLIIHRGIRCNLLNSVTINIVHATVNY
jgi:hypothetical protein